ncbi:hypothetical protein ACJJTC_014602 [Scirpophaga incertulas]
MSTVRTEFKPSLMVIVLNWPMGMALFAVLRWLKTLTIMIMYNMVQSTSDERAVEFCLWNGASGGVMNYCDWLSPRGEVRLLTSLTVFRKRARALLIICRAARCIHACALTGTLLETGSERNAMCNALGF